ncbi:hypothetical protein AB0I81_01140 [Nonomuraea sp. NPDC050404]|uniref:hypothetical protein n=1 Tax=Nonomuraea sp. NPDC050404 TaxID=3155783 RepID=UPI00340EF97D
MKKLSKFAAVSLGVVTASVVLTQPASAANYSWNVGDGTITYTDSSNTLCVRAFDTGGARQVTTNLFWSDKNNYYGDPGSSCGIVAGRELPEGTRIVIHVRTYWGERGTWVSKGNKTFYR